MERLAIFMWTKPSGETWPSNFTPQDSVGLNWIADAFSCSFNLGVSAANPEMYVKITEINVRGSENY